MSKSNVWDEPETQRLIGLDKLRKEHDEDEALLRELHNEDAERAADRVEEACQGWRDWRGFPIPGFESPRFVSQRESEYKAWYRSRDGERTRRQGHR
jgi:hypothetical protein